MKEYSKCNLLFSSSEILCNALEFYLLNEDKCKINLIKEELTINIEF